VADCFRGGFQPPETHDRQQWTAVYVGSPATRMTTTGDGDTLAVFQNRNLVYYEYHKSIVLSQVAVVKLRKLTLLCGSHV